jgi:putative transcription factor
MVRCEVCGREVRGRPHRRVIEGARMMVCNQCSRFGSEEWTPTPQPISRPRPRRRNEVESAESLLPVEGYGRLIRESREKQGLEPKEFARVIGEKISTILKLEKEEFVPNQALARKIKRVLKVDVLKKETSRISFITSTPPWGGQTLGDLVKLKEKNDN